MDRSIYAEDETGGLVAMTPAEPPSEDELQALIADHPDIVGEVEGELLFIGRESGIPDAGGAAARWAVDHLFVTRGAVPVLLEVKRATDTRLRREVVGQLLDYAANGTAYWPSGTLEGAFRASCARQGEDADDRLAAFVGDGEAASFWQQVSAHGQRWPRPAADLLPLTRSDQRCPWRARATDRSAAGQKAARRPRLRRGLAPRRAEDACLAHLHPSSMRPPSPRTSQQEASQEALPDRGRLCPSQGLARHSDPAHTRCADLFLSAICLAATVIVWLR